MPGPIVAAGCRLEVLERLRDDPAGQPAPAAVQHRDAAGRHKRDRQAVGREHEERHGSSRRDDARRPAGARRRVPRSRRRSPAGRPTRGRRCRAPASPSRCARVEPGAAPAARGSRLVWSSSVRMPRLSDSYGPSLTPPARVEKTTCAPGRSTSITEHLQRVAQLFVAARDLAVELGTQRLGQRPAERGRLDARGDQVVRP